MAEATRVSANEGAAGSVPTAIAQAAITPARTAAELKQQARGAADKAQWTEMLALLDEALALDAEDFEIHHWRGVALNELGRRDEAVAAARRAVELKSDAVGPWVSLCWYQILANQPAAARPACEKGYALDSSRIGAAMNMGSTYLLEGRRDEAWVWYRRALDRVDSEEALRTRVVDDLQLFQRRGWQAALAREAQAWFEAESKPHFALLAQGMQLRSDAAAAVEAGNYPRALVLLQRRLRLLGSRFDADAPPLVAARNAVAGVQYLHASALLAAGHAESALPLYREILATVERDAGPGSARAIVSISDVGRALHAAGRYAEALPYYQRALALSEKTLGPAHSTTGTRLNNLAGLYRDMGRDAAALPLYQRALAISEQADGPAHLSTGITLGNIADIYRAAGRHAEALDYAQRALAIIEAARGPGDPAIGTALNNLAGLLDAMGRYAEALPLYQRSLAIAEKAHGAEHPATAASLNNLATLYLSMGRHAEALPLYQRALAIYEKMEGPDHPATAIALSNLAEFYRITGRYAEALPMFRRALAVSEKARGPQHPATAGSLANLGGLYVTMGLYADALPLYRRALAVTEKALGADHPATAARLANLAEVYEAMGLYAEALPLARRALAIVEKTPGPDHPDTGAQLSNLAHLYRVMGRYADALPLAWRALAIAEKAQGTEHPSTGIRLSELVSLHHAMGQYQAALPLARRALAINEKKYGPEHPDTSKALNDLAGIYRELGNYAEALPLARRALAISEKALGPAHRATAARASNLALLLSSAGDDAAALPLYQRALATLEQAAGSDHPSTGISLHNLAGLYDRLGRHDEALPLYQRALLIATGNSEASPELAWAVEVALSRTYARRGQPDLSIFFGKQAVNVIQHMRAGLTSLDRDMQRAFVGNRSDAYRSLAGLLIGAGRLPEAQQVMQMLKEEEYFEFVRRDSSRDQRSTAVTYTAGEEPWRRRYAEISTQVGGIGAELAALDSKARAGLSEAESARREALRNDRKVAQQAFDAFLGDFMRTMESAGAQRNREVGERGLANLRALQGTLGALGHSAVTVHYLMGEEHLSILLTTPAVQIARTVAVPARELNALLAIFQRQLQDDRQDPLPLAQKLYQLLVAPIANDLKQAKAQTLMVSLDGALRYIPLAALHDGARYLVEDYRIALFTEAAKDKLRLQPQAHWRVAALGVTGEKPGFTALPSVKTELEGIVKSGSGGVLPGEIHLDADFTARRMREALDRAFPVLHVASHFHFSPGAEAGSFLLLGDGNRLTLQNIQEDDYRFQDVDLMTLSACETAVGGGKDANGMEIEGFGALVQKQGAKAVVATLWQVADDSTGLLMRQFYALRESGSLTKAEALRQAQLQFIRGLPVEGIGGARGDDKPLSPRRAAAYRHPYYWAPFILMGNWL